LSVSLLGGFERVAAHRASGVSLLAGYDPRPFCRSKPRVTAVTWSVSPLGASSVSLLAVLVRVAARGVQACRCAQASSVHCSPFWCVSLFSAFERVAARRLRACRRSQASSVSLLAVSLLAGFERVAARRASGVSPPRRASSVLPPAALRACRPSRFWRVAGRRLHARRFSPLVPLLAVSLLAVLVRIALGPAPSVSPR